MEKVKIEEIRPIMEECFDEGSGFTFKPGGTSMLPYIRGTRDLVTIRRYEGGAKKYDVVFFKRDSGKYVMHRIIGKKGSDHLVCGDNQCWKELVRDDMIFAYECCVSKDGKEMKKGVLYGIYCRTLFIRRFYIRGKRWIVNHILKGRGK